MSTLIQGGGLVGLGLLWELDRRGVPAHLIDWPQPGRASVVAAGMLAPQVEAERDSALFALWRDAFARYRDDVAGLGGDVGYVECGAILPAKDEATRTALDARFAWQTARDLPATWLTPREAAARAPGVDVGVGAWWLPESAQVEPSRLHARLTERCLEKGLVDIYEREPRVDVDEKGVVLDGARRFERLVVADGAWHRWLGGGVRPVRGQLLELALPGPTATTLVVGAGGYLVPRGDGRVIVGSTTEDVGFDASTTDAARALLTTRARALWPALASAEVKRHLSGFRPATSDGLPVIGAIGERVFVLGGAYRNGVLLAFALGRAMADVLTSQPRPELDAFSPRRSSLATP